MSTTPEHDPVNHPKHYTSHPSGVECITITRHMGFCLGNAVKYLWRAGMKDSAPPVEDLKKAIWYIQEEIKLREASTVDALDRLSAGIEAQAEKAGITAADDEPLGSRENPIKEGRVQSAQWFIQHDVARQYLGGSMTRKHGEEPCNWADIKEAFPGFTFSDL